MLLFVTKLYMTTTKKLVMDRITRRNYSLGQQINNRQMGIYEIVWLT